MSVLSIVTRVLMNNVGAFCTNFCHLDHVHWTSSRPLKTWLLFKLL